MPAPERERSGGGGFAGAGAGMSNEEKYVAAAYLVVFGVILIYFVIMALKVSRLEREVGELADLARKRRDG
jgi:CcmD family protein